MAETVSVNPKILEWARESAGLTVSAAARKLALTEERLEKLEKAEAAPTQSLLMRMADIYRRPLVAFYMSAPPRAAEPVRDFRTLAASPPPEEKALLDALVRDIRARQSIARDLLEDDEDAGELPFVAGSKTEDGVEGVVDRIRKVLRVSHGDQKGAKDVDALFKLIRGRTEEAGIFVLLAGDLGSPQHNSISPKTFRGYALIDKIAPFIVINDKDAKAARLFTLIHELAHIFIGAEGISGPTEAEAGSLLPPIEVFCNQVASEFLLPALELPTLDPERANDEDYVRSLVDKVAKYWNVSRPVVLYRFYRAKRIKQDVWADLRDGYQVEYDRIKAKEKESNAGKEGGPDYYVVRRDRLGNGLLKLARQTINSGLLSYTAAAKLLAVRPSNVAPLLNNGR